MRDLVRLLTLSKGSCGDDEPAGLGIAISASGEAAQRATALATSKPLQATYGGCAYEWSTPIPDAAAVPCDLWIHVGDPPAAWLREICAPDAVFIDIGRLGFAGRASGAVAPPEIVQAQLARDLAAINVLPGHVCVDFADVAAILPRVTTVIRVSGSDSTAAPKALEEALREAGAHSATCALVLVTFPVGGGKLAHSKEALTLVRAALNPGADVVYSTTQDAELPRSSVRIVVLADAFINA